jgi:hypothetical protein
MKTKTIDERKMFTIRLNKEEYEALQKEKNKENLPMRDGDVIKLFFIRYLGVKK